MASNNPSRPQSRTDLPDNITVRVITLAHGDRTENDLYLVLNLDTTVGELKHRIRDGLSRHPSPETQRLLYFGRPLLENNVTLRQVLRQEQRSASAGAPHVLHLVIRDTQGSNSQQPSNQPQPVGIPQPHVHLTNPQHGQIQFPPLQAGIPDLAHNMIHNSMHITQHQLQHQRAVEEANRRARGIHNHIAPQNNNIRPQNQTQAPRTGQTDERSPSPAPSLPSIQITQTPQMLGLPVGETPAQSTFNVPSPSSQTTRVQETIGPNGERIRTVISNNSMMFQIGGNNLPNPFDRPSSAPGTSPLTNSDPASRAGGPAVPPLQFHNPLPVLSAGLPLLPGGHLPLPFPPVPQLTLPPILRAVPSTPNQGQTMTWLLSSPQGPQGIVFAPGHGYFQSNAPSVTVLSQAPNHTLQPTPTVPLGQNQSETQPSSQPQQPSTTPAGRTGNDNPPPPQPGARPQPNIQDVARQGAQIPAPAVVPAQQQGNNDNDLLQLLINRGWLFLRLYMFVFIFSESGTWRRIIMLGSIIVFCLLPQQNPLTEMFDVMRRHFDRLIGPPQIPERQAAAPAQAQNQQLVPRDPGDQQNNNNQLARNTRSPQAVNEDSTNENNRPTPTTAGQHMPTPEQTARRLLAQHQDRRNAHPFLDMLYRIEQGAVLFLASLVPGVGERHVRAREEARRIVEAEDRRLREESERQSQNQSAGAGDNKTATATATTTANDEASASSSNNSATIASRSVPGEASSSSVDPARVSDGQQGIRSRNTGVQQ